jgi:hypothetical protein
VTAQTITTPERPATREHQPSIAFEDATAVLDGELEEMDLDDWPIPQGVGYRYNRHGALDPTGTYSTAELLRLHRRTWDDPEIDILRAHATYDQEDQDALAWMAYVGQDGDVPAELLKRARHTPTCKLVARHVQGLDWLAEQAPRSFLVFAHGGPGADRLTVARLEPQVLYAAIEAREQARQAWALDHKAQLLDLAVAVAALQQRAERHGELHFADPDFHAMVAQVRVQLREVGRGALAEWLADAAIGRALVRGEFHRDGVIQESGHAVASDPWTPAGGELWVSEDSPEADRDAYAVHWARVDLAHRYSEP